MDQDRLEYAEASQGGKRRSSLGALSKSKPVTKLKSMFEAKGPAPKIKESGLLGKLKPISASHDATSFAAALSGSMASLKMSVGGPPQQPPPTPIAPLFSVLPAPVEPDVLPQPSPPRSAEDLQMSLPVYQESLPDGGDVDARKSPGSAGFLKRMSSSLKKALTPKSSTGKQKADGFSPSYAGSDASNLSPRPSAQLLMTPGSQPSSTSMDLNSRSDQTQSAPTRSPSALMGYEVHVARDYPEWTRPCEGGVDSTFRPTSSSSRPPRSPSMAHPPSGSVPDGVSAQHEASPPIASRDVSPRPLPTSSPDQSQTFKCIAQDAGAPMGENENFVNADSKGPAVPPVAQDVVPEDSFAASLTASPTVPDCSDGSHGSPPMREVNMGAATSSSPQLPSSNPRTDACDIVADLQADELVFPSLLSTDQYGPVIHIVEAVASHVSDGLGAQTDESADVDMGACDSGPPIEELQAAVPSSDEMPNAERAAAEIDAPVSLMEVDSAAQQEPVFQQPVPLATRRTFGAAGSLNLDLSGAENNSPGSPDTATPTGPAPKIKESGLLGKLKPISASHDATSFAAALSGTMASLKMSVGGPPQQPPPTPIAPLFSVLPAPVEPDVLPQPSPPRSAEDLQMSLPVYQESLPDGGDVDARKSPGSAGFLKRTSSSLEKALTPKSSTGKQKADGFSPSYAGSDASNLSPRPSAQLLMTPGSQPSSTSMDLNSRSDQTQSAPTRSPSALMGYEVHVARDYPEWTRPCEGGVDSTFRPTSSSSRPPRSPSMAHPPSGSVPDGVSAQHEASPPIASRDVSPRPLPTSSPDQSQTFKCIAQDAGAPMGENENFVNADSKGPAVPPVAQDVVPEDSFAASLTASPTVPDCSDGSHGSPPMREVNMGAATSSSPQLPSSNPRTDACDIVADLQADELVFPSLLSTDQYGPVIHIVEAVASHVSDGLGAQTDESADVDMGACDSGPPIEELQAAVPSSDEMPNAERAAAEIDAPVSLMEVDSAAQQEPVFQQPVPLATRRTFGAAGSLNLDLSGAENNSPGSPDTATPTGAAADNQEDDPMMVSPMPQRWSTVPLVVHVGLGQVMPDMGAPDAAQSTSSLPGDATKISPDTARLGLRAFQLNDIEEPAAIVEARAYGEMAVQEEVTRQGDDWSAETPDALAPLQSISPIIDNMNIGTVTPVTTADGHVDGSAATTTAADVESAVELPTDVSAPDLIASVPSVAAPPPLPVGEDVPVADSLEAIEALWGNDDLLEEPGSATAKGLTPQVASSPVSTSKQAESPFTSQSGRKVGPGVVLQVERESLDLFSLRNSCASRVSDSLMVESLDSFESMGLCAKSRAMGFVPMAPLKEGDEDLAMVGRTNGSDGESGTTSAGPQSPNVTFSVNNGGSPDSQATPGLNAAAATAVVTPSANKPACSSGGRGSTSSAAAGMVKAPGSAAKAATPSVAARPSATPSTALKAMAAANAAGASASKACISKRPLPNPAPQPRQISTPGQQVALPSGPSSGSRLPGFTATPASGTSRTPAPIPGVKPSMPSTSAGSTPGAVPARQGVTPRSGGVFSSGKGQNPISGISRPGLFAHQPAVVGRPGSGLFDTPVIFRAAAVPLADTPFSASDFDLDTVDISAEASKAIALLGGGDASIAGAAAQHATPALAAVRGAVMPGTPTLSVLETHVQLLTNKLAEAEDNINQLQNANAMLRDQLSTLQFKLSMTNDLDMERDAREYLEHELSTLRHQTGGLEADLRAAHAEIKRYEQAAAETLAAQQSKEAEWARKEVELEQRMQQMTSEVEAARSFAQQADARNAEAEARAAAATAKCDEETARGRELQVTLGLQAHQLVQVQRARDDAEAKFQRAMEQLIAAQTSHKKAVVEYEQKLLQSSNLVSQINDVRDKYRQMKQHAANAEQRAQHAEAKAQETANALAKANMEKAELMQMCNELLTQLEATKVKGGR